MIFLPRIYNEQDKDGQTPIMVCTTILRNQMYHWKVDFTKFNEKTTIFFQIAVKRQNVPAIKHLVSKEVDLARKDSKLNNVFHFTATTNKEIIEVNISNFHFLNFFSTWSESSNYTIYLYLDVGRESNVIKGTKRRRIYAIAHCMCWRYARMRPSISLCRSVNKRMKISDGPNFRTMFRKVRLNF